MHVAVLADIEGAFGIWRMRQCRSGTAEWQYGRRCLTADVNQVIAGAFEAEFRSQDLADKFNTWSFEPKRQDCILALGKYHRWI